MPGAIHLQLCLCRFARMGMAAEVVDTVPIAVDGNALLRRIDLRVIPILFVVYLAAFLDRYPPLHICCAL